MKTSIYLTILIAFIAGPVAADCRLNGDTNSCHFVYGIAANEEYENSCTITLKRDGNNGIVAGWGVSCTIPPGEVRKIENRRNDVCTMLVVIPYPPEV